MKYILTVLCLFSCSIAFADTPDQRMLATYFKQAMADHDYDRADRLANTDVQHQAVDDARQKERRVVVMDDGRAAAAAQAAADKKATQPKKCRMSSYTYNGVTNGVMSCPQ